MRQALMLTVLLLLVPLSGCLGQTESPPSQEADTLYPSIWDRHTLEWNWTGSYARVLQDGPHQPLPVQEAFIDVDTTGTWEGGPNSAEVHLSYWLPSNTEAGEQVPVIAIVSPYFDYGSPGSQSSPTNVVGAGRGEFIYDNFIPHGYALAQVAVFATEESTGCFDYRGDGEGQGIHAAVEWLGTQNWSNGHVAIYGKSYEGATAWEAAAQGSEYLKTIVPISGTTALGPLLYKNGSAEARSQVMHSNYGGSILDYDGDDLDNMCGDVLEGFLAGPMRYGLGELDPYMDSTTMSAATSTRHSARTTGASTGFRACRTGTLTLTRCLAAHRAPTGTKRTSTPVTKSAACSGSGSTTTPTSGPSTTTRNRDTVARPSRT